MILFTKHVNTFEILFYFQTFVDWLDDEDLIDDIWGHYYNRVISKYVHRCYKELLELFRFASFYAIDNLLDSLTYIIILKWLQRDNLIELWLLAEELNQDNLKRAVFATCLDLFEQLPEDAIISLPKENFEQLVNNANLRSSGAHRQRILSEWAKQNARKPDEEDSESSDDSSQVDFLILLIIVLDSFGWNINYIHFYIFFRMIPLKVKPEFWVVSLALDQMSMALKKRLSFHGMEID